MDINVHLNITAPELTTALLQLIASSAAPLGAPVPIPAQAAPAPAPVAAIAAPAYAAPAPVQPAPMPTPVPVATPPTYTLEALANAAAPLVQAGKQPELMALLGQFGVQAMGQLKQEQYGAFATALRQMGGKI